jgi:hypothetical protein
MNEQVGCRGSLGPTCTNCSLIAASTMSRKWTISICGCICINWCLLHADHRKLRNGDATQQRKKSQPAYHAQLRMHVLHCNFLFVYSSLTMANIPIAIHDIINRRACRELIFSHEDCYPRSLLTEFDLRNTNTMLHL